MWTGRQPQHVLGFKSKIDPESAEHFKMASYDYFSWRSFEYMANVPDGCILSMADDDFNAPYIVTGDCAIINPMLLPVDPISHGLYLFGSEICSFRDPPSIYHIIRRMTPWGERCVLGLTSFPGIECSVYYTVPEMRGMICGRVVGFLDPVIAQRHHVPTWIRI
jgi:hypothetical protein